MKGPRNNRVKLFYSTNLEPLYGIVFNDKVRLNSTEK